jgi:hypothetical protein
MRHKACCAGWTAYTPGDGGEHGSPVCEPAVASWSLLRLCCGSAAPALPTCLGQHGLRKLVRFEILQVQHRFTHTHEVHRYGALHGDGGNHTAFGGAV